MDISFFIFVDLRLRLNKCRVVLEHSCVLLKTNINLGVKNMKRIVKATVALALASASVLSGALAANAQSPDTGNTNEPKIVSSYYPTVIPQDMKTCTPSRIILPKHEGVTYSLQRVGRNMWISRPSALPGYKLDRPNMTYSIQTWDVPCSRSW